MDEFCFQLMATQVPGRTFKSLLHLIIASSMKPTALIRLAFLTLCMGLMFGPSTALSQIGLPPAQEPPKGEKVDEQTQLQNRMREKDEMKKQMAERGEKTPPKKPAQPVQRAPRPTPKPPTPKTNLGQRPKLVIGITVDQMRMDYLLSLIHI